MIEVDDAGHFGDRIPRAVAEAVKELSAVDVAGPNRPRKDRASRTVRG